MANHDYVIDNQSAPAFRADLNNVLAAIVTQNSSAIAPTVTFANMLWYDTANNQIKKRDEANSNWIVLGTVDETAGTFTPSGLPPVASLGDAQSGTGTGLMNATLTAAAIEAQFPDHLGPFASGAAGELKLDAVALANFYLTRFNLTTSTFAITNLSRVQILQFMLALQGVASLSVAFSTNNGTSYGTPQTIFSITDNLSGFLGLSLDIYSGQSRAFGFLSAGTSSQHVNTNTTLTIPAGVNAIRFTCGGVSTRTVAGLVNVVGGRA